MTGFEYWVPVIVVCIICLQIFFFARNLQRMYVFRNIFSRPETWKVKKDDNTGFVNGIEGHGNNVFYSIRESINKYLGNMAGSVIDFQLMKDAIDRHCDSVEEEISTQTPVPLYCGLAGTMIGVIIGLGSLLYTGSIDALIGGAGTGNVTPAQAQKMMTAAASGINELLTGVAWAMVASICGIALTTINSLLYKGCKLNEEKEKNDFLVWMQSHLLPELPGDTSDALTRLVRNLNEFNSTFSENTNELRDALKGVNESYAYQAEIIQNVHDMDVMKMARANVNVLRELQECTDKLETFNTYLDSIKGYTDSIQKFNEQFNEEAERLHVMEEIRDFFERNKAEIARNVTDEDDMLKRALESLKETSSQSVDELKVSLTEQSDKFKALNKQMCDEYTQRLGEMPKLQTQLEEVAQIPKHLTSLAHRIEMSNQELVDKINRTLKLFAKSSDSPNVSSSGSVSSMPGWMKMILTLCAVIITACVMGMAYMMYEKESSNNTQETPVSPFEEYYEGANDSVMSSNGYEQPQNEQTTDSIN